MKPKLQQWRVGDVFITQIVETELRFRCDFLFPNSDLADLAAMSWLWPDYIAGDRDLIISVHALVVDAGDQRILIDTCYGNNKDRASGFGHMLQTPFLEQLLHAGFPLDSVDVVLCTHLHPDHVGWNTRLEKGRWIPTFPRARYVIGRAEFEHWGSENAKGAVAYFEDSVAPLVDAGLVDLVETDYRLNDFVSLVPSPGHTPGHVSVRIVSGGEEALISGDAFHHPCQCGHPGWVNAGDYDGPRAIKTRSALFEDLADGGALLIGTHFAAPAAGRVVRNGLAYRFIGSRDCQRP